VGLGLGIKILCSKRCNLAGVKEVFMWENLEGRVVTMDCFSKLFSQTKIWREARHLLAFPAAKIVGNSI
jgi:hypothetical protein